MHLSSLVDRRNRTPSRRLRANAGAGLRSAPCPWPATVGARVGRRDRRRSVKEQLDAHDGEDRRGRRRPSRRRPQPRLLAGRVRRIARRGGRRGRRERDVADHRRGGAAGVPRHDHQHAVRLLRAHHHAGAALAGPGQLRRPARLLDLPLRPPRARRVHRAGARGPRSGAAASTPSSTRRSSGWSPTPGRASRAPSRRRSPSFPIGRRTSAPCGSSPAARGGPTT